MKPARRLIPANPSSPLRARATALRAELAKAIRTPAPLPARGSEAARAAFKAACHAHSLRKQFADDYPELDRTPLAPWTMSGLGKAMEAGAITPAECARLYPLASERELRMAALEHELNLGSLFALAFADEFPEPAPNDGARDTSVGSPAKRDRTTG